MKRLLPLVLLVACAPDYDAPFYMHGRVLQEDGSAAAGERLVLFSNDKEIASLEASETGEFTFVVTYADLSSYRGGAGALRIVRPPSVSGVVNQAHIRTFGAQDFRIPDWQNRSLTLTRLPDGLLRVPTDDGGELYTLEVRGPDGLLWRESVNEGDSRRVPSRLAGSTADAHASLHRFMTGRSGTPQNLLGQMVTVSYAFEVISPPITIDRAETVPVSRGVPCVLDEVVHEPCPFTDGDLVTPIYRGVVDLTLSFEQAFSPRRALFRGMTGGKILLVEGRADELGEWILLVRHSLAEEKAKRAELGILISFNNEFFLDLELSSPAPITQLRVRDESAGVAAFYSLSELSIF